MLSEPKPITKMNSEQDDPYMQYVLSKLDEGEEDIKAGRVVDADVVIQKLKERNKAYGKG